MVGLLALALSLLIPSSFVLAAPLNEEKRNGVTAASSSQISSFVPYIAFAHASYCTAAVGAWTCGNACQYGISDFVWHAGGGSGGAAPHWYVGWSPSLDSIILVHEGTDPVSLAQDLEDIDFIQTKLDSHYFPNVPSNVRIHEGFQKTFVLTADTIAKAIQEVQTARSATKITVIGHSLGGALTHLSSVYIKLHFPSLTLKAVAISSPRVGNSAFASYMGSFDLTRINHQQDPVPTLPGRLMGFLHPQGEIHQSLLDGVWYNCPGQDNPDIRCNTGAVPTIFQSNIVDHGGPFEGIWLGTIFCG